MSKKANFYSGKVLVTSVAAAALGLAALNTQDVKADQTTDQSVDTEKLKQTVDNILPVENTPNGADNNLSNQASSETNEKVQPPADTPNGADNNLSNQTGSETNEKVQPPVNDNQPTQPKQTIKTVATSPRSIKWKNSDNQESDVTLTLVHGADHPGYRLEISGGTITNPQSLSEVFGDDTNSIDQIKITDTLKITGVARALFGDLKNLTQLEGLEKLDTSDVTIMSAMFKNCSMLTSLDVSHFNTSKVTQMSMMFSNCRSLYNLDVSHFDTSQAEYINYMFGNCYKLRSLDVSHFNTSNVTEMSEMFSGCRSLYNLDLTSFDTSKVKDNAQYTQYMFYDCANLNTLKLGSKFITPKSRLDLDFPERTPQDGKWHKVGSGTSVNPEDTEGQSDSFIDNFDGSKDAGTYVRLDSENSTRAKNITVHYLDKNNDEIKNEICEGLLGEVKDISAASVITDNNGQKYFLTTDSKKLQHVTFTDQPQSISFYYIGIDAAKQAIQEEAQATKQKIDADSSLTKDEKKIQKETVDAAITEANTKIDEATDADGVNTAITNGKVAIKNVYQPGTKENIPNAGSSIQNVRGGDVTVHYQDEQGNILASDEILKGYLGEGYTSQEKKINGYSLKLRPEKATGFFENNPQSITYVYTLDQAKDQAKISKKLMHNAFIYDINHHRVGNSKFHSYENIMVYPEPVRLTDGVLAYKLANNQYMLAANIDGTLRQLKHNSYVYQTGRKRANHQLLRKGSYIRTYGAPYQFKNGKLYYRIGGPKKQYVKVKKFK